MRLLLLTLGLVFGATQAAVPQTPLRRMIDRCAQDGLYFYAVNDDVSQPVQVERDGVKVQIEHPRPKGNDAVITFSRENHFLVQKQQDFEAAEGWLIASRSGAFAATWNVSAYSASTQLFRMTSKRDIVEDTTLIPRAERMFTADARRFCINSGLNSTAIKWVDDDHLLLSIDARSFGFCGSDFTEGFILNVSSDTIERKLSERQLIDLPAVCTWNIVPTTKH
jgi:hypothetical protein